MTLERAISEVMQIYGALSSEKQRAIDTLIAETKRHTDRKETKDDTINLLIKIPDSLYKAIVDSKDVPGENTAEDVLYKAVENGVIVSEKALELEIGGSENE